MNPLSGVGARPAVAFNDVLRMALAGRGRASVVDWSAVAHHDDVLGDGVHPSALGVRVFRDRVVAAVDAWSV